MVTEAAASEVVASEVLAMGAEEALEGQDIVAVATDEEEEVASGVVCMEGTVEAALHRLVV